MDAGAPWLGRHVLGRGLVHARRISLAGIVPKDRAGRLRVEAAQWRPFDDADYVVCIDADDAWLYAWDRSAFAARVADTPVQRARQVLPETLLFAPPSADGARLLACREGFAAELWADGRLQATRWWPGQPSTADWTLFLRGAGQPADDEAPPAALSLEQAGSRPRWARVRRLTESGGDEGRSLPLMAGALGLALWIPAVWLARDHWAVAADTAVLEAERAELENSAAPQLQARREALEALAGVDYASAWLSRPDPVAVLAAVAQRWPADGSTVREFQFADAQLRLALVPAAGTARVAYVQALEEGGAFRRVREESGENADSRGLLLRAELADDFADRQAARPADGAASGAAGAAAAVAATPTAAAPAVSAAQAQAPAAVPAAKPSAAAAPAPAATRPAAPPPPPPRANRTPEPAPAARPKAEPPPGIAIPESVTPLSGPGAAPQGGTPMSEATPQGKGAGR